MQGQACNHMTGCNYSIACFREEPKHERVVDIGNVESFAKKTIICLPVQGVLNKVDICSLSPFAPENLVLRDRFGCPVPGQPAHFPHSSGLFWCLLITGFHSLSTTASNKFYTRQSPSGPKIKGSRNGETMAFTAKSHSIAGTAPVCTTGWCLFRYIHGPILVRLFLHEYASPRGCTYSRSVYREVI